MRSAEVIARMGWTLAAGTGWRLADWMSGRSPEIETDGLTIKRYGATH